MKKLMLLATGLLFTFQSVASTTVQRTVHSSYADYQRYVGKEGRKSFIDAYIELSAVMEMETPLLEKCLEEVYLGAPSEVTCLSAVKSLSTKPLNQTRREVLFSFLMKLKKTKAAQRNFYSALQTGLLQTHPKLAQTFHIDASSEQRASGSIQELEMKAWKKAVGRIFPLEEVALLINGTRVSKLEKWSAPQGVYQWSLITNTHEPIVRLGTFSQFASESLKELKPLADTNCKGLEELDPQKFGILQIEVFSDSKCVARFGMTSPIAKTEPHLGNSSSMVQMEESSQRHWIWPALLLLGVGVAASLKDKQVSVEMPSFH